jgi:sigma-E factor negative regulatory protein RseA
MVMEKLSALMDGELDDAEAQRQIAAIRTDAEAREQWEAFHLIGDALRHEPLLAASVSAKVATRLAEEPTVLAPKRLARAPKRATTYAWSAAASVAAAAFVGWVALSGGNGESGISPALVAQPQSGMPLLNTAGPSLPLPQVTPASMPNDGSIKDYLLAHEAVAPGAYLGGFAPVIRTVSAIRQGQSR